MLILSAAILASMSYMYPIYLRLGLYLVPFFILLAAKPFDVCIFKKGKIKAILSSVFILAFIISFGAYNLKYFSGFLKPSVFSRGLSGEMMEIIKENISKNKNAQILLEKEESGSYLAKVRFKPR